MPSRKWFQGRNTIPYKGTIPDDIIRVRDIAKRHDIATRTVTAALKKEGDPLYFTGNGVGNIIYTHGNKRGSIEFLNALESTPKNQRLAWLHENMPKKLFFFQAPAILRLISREFIAVHYARSLLTSKGILQGHDINIKKFLAFLENDVKEKKRSTQKINVPVLRKDRANLEEVLAYLKQTPWLHGSYAVANVLGIGYKGVTDRLSAVGIKTVKTTRKTNIGTEFKVSGTALFRFLTENAHTHHSLMAFFHGLGIQCTKRMLHYYTTLALQPRKRPHAQYFSMSEKKAIVSKLIKHWFNAQSRSVRNARLQATWDAVFPNIRRNLHISVNNAEKVALQLSNKKTPKELKTILIQELYSMVLKNPHITPANVPNLKPTLMTLAQAT